MDPANQSDACTLVERIIQLDTEWTLKVRHQDISALAGPVVLIDTNVNRVKLSITLRPVTDSDLEISQIDPALLGGSVTGIQISVTAASQQSQTLRWNIEDDKAECTQKWWAFGTCCLYISEVIYTGNSRRCLTTIVDNSESTECPNQTQTQKESNNGEECSCYCP